MEVSEEFSIVVSVELTLTKLNRAIMSLLDHNILISKSDKHLFFVYYKVTKYIVNETLSHVKKGLR